MISSLLSLPLFLGLIIFIVAFVMIGLLAYGITRRIIKNGITDDNREIANQLLRVSGALLALLLSLTFADVRSELVKLRDSIDLEAAQIVDMYSDLETYGDERSTLIQQKLIHYTRALIEKEWEQLSLQSFDYSTFTLAEEIQDDILMLKPNSSKQELLRSNLLDDIDEISDYRQMRQYAAKSDPPIFFYISLFGYVVTIGIFSVYPPRRNSLILLSFYCAFIGVVIYFILALSNPFNGTMQITPDSLQQILDTVLKMT